MRASPMTTARIMMNVHFCAQQTGRKVEEIGREVIDTRFCRA